MSDFLLQKSSDRGQLYHQPPGIRYSAEMHRWLVTSPELIREAMTNEALSVPSYDVSPVLARLKVNLPVTDAVRTWFPLAEEGERHRDLREIFARRITARTRPALEATATALEAGTAMLAAQPAGVEFCMFQAFVRPVARAAVLALAEMEAPADADVELIPQMFDGTASMARRKRVEAVMVEMLEHGAQHLTPDEQHLRLAIVALSANTLLGSISLTVAERLRQSPGLPMQQIDWGSELQRTSLPLVEKWAVRDTTLGGASIRSGDRVRLFIEAGGLSAGNEFTYSDLFFAVGAHKCLGMSFSRQVWARVAASLASVPRRLRLIDVRERQMDHVFNLPEEIRVSFDD